MAQSTIAEQIHVDMLSYGAIRGKDDDGLTHLILRQDGDYVDLEYASDGSYSLQMSVNGETYSADASNPSRMAQVWEQWCFNNK